MKKLTIVLVGLISVVGLGVLVKSKNKTNREDDIYE